MKTSRLRLATLNAALCLCALSASNLVAQQNPGTVRMIPTDDPDSGPGTSPQMSKDRMFLHNAAEGGMAEVQLGQLAVQKSTNDDVKKFAQRMVDDHTALNASLEPFAKSLGAKPPKKLAKNDQAELTKLGGLSGAEFDKEYLAYMVKDHHKDLADFHQEAQTAGTPGLKTAVTQGETTIQEHTVMVDQLAKANGIAVPVK